MNTILYSIMLSVFVCYVLYISFKYGIQSSISHSFYILPKNKKFLFILFCWFLALPAIVLGDSTLMFFAGAGICFVGGAAAYLQEKMTNNVHMTGAYSGVLLSQLAIYFNYDMLYVNIIFISISLLLYLLYKYFNFKNIIWWIEVLAFASIIFAIGMKLFLQ